MGSAGERKVAADILAMAKARTARVALVLDGDLLAEHERLTGRLEALATDSPEAAALADEILAVEEQLQAAEIQFVFRGMGRGRWRKLLADHPPTDADRQQGLDFDPDSFPFEAMAASLVEPEFTADELRTLHEDSLSEMSFQALWTGCLKANLGSGPSRPESRAAHAIAANGRRK